MPVLQTAGSIGPGQSDLSANGRIACPSTGTTNVPIATLPAGKTFFLTDVQLSTTSTSEIDVQVAYTLTANSVTVTVPIYRAAIQSTSPCNALGIESQPDAPGTSQLVMILPGVSGNPNVDFTVSGFMQ